MRLKNLHAGMQCSPVVCRKEEWRRGEGTNAHKPEIMIAFLSACVIIEMAGRFGSECEVKGVRPLKFRWLMFQLR